MSLDIFDRPCDREARARGFRITFDALLSIADHAKEFGDLEDPETMVASMTKKANNALKKIGYEHH